MMVISIGAETAKLAGLQTDLLQKLRDGQLTLDQIEWWLNQRSENRERYMQPDFRDVVRGASQIVVVKHIIDCDVDPFVPQGLEVVEHKKGGSFEWDPKKVQLYLSPNQQNGKHIKGDLLRKELENKPVFNANVLDYLLAHQELIPEEWKGKCIFFWGTVYRDSGGDLCVRYLCWYSARWDWSCYWLGNDWYGNYPAACPQVSS